MLDAAEFTKSEKRDFLAHAVEAVYPEAVPEVKATTYSVVLKPITIGDLTVVNVNKASTAVQLRSNVANSSPPLDVQARLTQLAGIMMTADGVVVLEAQTERT